MDGGGRESNTKVARVIESYGLEAMGARLEASWTAESGERTSLRDLADEFNETVLETALREAGASPLDAAVSSLYETLEDGSGSAATRTRRRLEREGLDVDALTADFVTHQAIHTYLTEARGASLPTDDRSATERKVETIEKLRGRTAAVTESAIASLANAGELDNAEYDVLVDVRTICPNCGADAAAGEVIRQGGCDCGDSTEPVAGE